MNNEHQNKILEKAIAVQGNDNKFDMLGEEVGELIKALNKFKREYGNDVIMNPMPVHSRQYCLDYYDVCSEIADVKVVIRQLEMIFSREAVDISEDRKIARLGEKIDKIERSKLTNK